MTFRVGQKVVCVDSSPLDGTLGWMTDADAPQEGAIYTVTGNATIRFRGKDHGAVFLMEIKNSAHGGLYGAFRFRPVVERKTDISVFQKILDDANSKVTA